MRTRSILTALFVTFTLVLGIDYVSFAATGKSVLLGKTNASRQSTVLKRTTAGPPLTLKPKSGSPALKVTTGKKIDKLNADTVDGVHAAQLATRVSAFTPADCKNLTAVTTTPTAIADIGTFTKSSGATTVELDYSTFFSVDSMTANGTTFELRVDDAPTSLGVATILLRQAGSIVPGHISGIYPGLAAGQHTVSVWAFTSPGTASNAYIGTGCFNSYKGSNVYVKEFL